MTDQQLDSDRLNITKQYLETGEMLDLESDLSISIDSSARGIYHIFSNGLNGLKVFEYSISDLKLKELVQTLPINTIKKIFVEDKLYRLRNKFIGENKNPPFNLLDHEQAH